MQSLSRCFTSVGRKNISPNDLHPVGWLGAERQIKGEKQGLWGLYTNLIRERVVTGVGGERVSMRK